MNRSTRDLLDHLRRVATPMIPAAGHVTAHIAGGAAVSHYTGRRSTGQADIAWAHRVLIRPQDRFLTTVDRAGDPFLMTIMPGVPEMTNMFHPDWRDRAYGIARDPGFTVMVISPPDLVLSLASRLDERATEDIREIADMTTVEPDTVRRLGEETIERFVGGTDRLRKNLNKVVKILEDYVPRNEPGW